MRTLAFLPWFVVDQEHTAGGLRLERYERGHQPFGPASADQRTADALLGRYFTHRDRLINAATMVGLADKDLLGELSEEEIAQLFEAAKLLGISALAERTFFDQLGPYCNSDTFSLVVQRFDDPSQGVSLRTRRRDGSNLTYVTADAFRTNRPEHVNAGIPRLQPNYRLWTALLESRGSEHWPRIEESTDCFNLANTDRSGIPEQVEAVLMVGALEHLLDCKQGKENDLARRFADARAPSEDSPTGRCGRLQARRARGEAESSGPVREAWVRDFFRTRHGPAHGRMRRTNPQARWSLSEHLVLGSFVFPLLVKKLLEQVGTYQLDPEDRLRIDAFEHLACDGFNQVQDSEDSGANLEWGRILSHPRLRQVMEDSWPQILDRTSGAKP